MRNEEILELAQEIECFQSSLDYLPDLIRAVIFWQETQIKRNKQDLIYMLDGLSDLIESALKKQSGAIEVLACRLAQQGGNNES